MTITDENTAIRYLDRMEWHPMKRDAAIWLAENGSVDAVPFLAKNANLDGVKQLAVAAILEISRRNQDAWLSEDSAQSLISVLRRGNPEEIRADAAMALGYFGYLDAIHVLAAATEDRAYCVREAAYRALVMLKSVYGFDERAKKILESEDAEGKKFTLRHVVLDIIPMEIESAVRERVAPLIRSVMSGENDGRELIDMIGRMETVKELNKLRDIIYKETYGQGDHDDSAVRNLAKIHSAIDRRRAAILENSGFMRRSGPMANGEPAGIPRRRLTT